VSMLVPHAEALPSAAERGDARLEAPRSFSEIYDASARRNLAHSLLH